MKMKAAVNKYMLPVFKEHGLNLDFSIGTHFVFKNERKTREIIVENTPKMPGDPWLRLRFTGYEEGRMFCFTDESLPPEFGLKDANEYSTQEQLEAHLKQITDAAVNNILPYMDKFEKRMVCITPEMYKPLSEDTQGCRSYDRALRASGIA
jgi:hypothetical protein